MEHARTWVVVGVVTEGEPIDVGGITPWDFDWTRTSDEAVMLPHPQHSAELHRLWIYRIAVGDRCVVFAAGELSANVWGFYAQRVRGCPSEPPPVPVQLADDAGRDDGADVLAGLPH